MSTPRPVLVIGTPCYGGQVTSLYTSSLLKLQLACQQRDIGLHVLMLGGDALITRARQAIVAHFLANDAATHLLFIDADIGFEPEQVFRLMDFDAEMSAAIYPVKKVDWAKLPALAARNPQNLESAALSYVLEFDDPKKIGVRNGFSKVRYTGTGFLMIRRSALLKMTEKYPDLKYSREHLGDDPLKDSPWRYALFNCLLDTERSLYLSEDYSFCRRWTDIGGEIWADLQSRLTHTGPVTFHGDVSTQFGPAA